MARRRGVAMATVLTLATLQQAASSYVLSTVTTEKPQRMWDPGSGSLLGQGVGDFGLENVTVTNQTAQLGSTAFLHCNVRNPADKQFPYFYQQVSWIRRRDYQLLTSGPLTYSRDQRFGVVRPEDADDWALQIKFVQIRDEGAYECQVSTRTGRYGYVVNLAVVVPEAVISGSPERHVQAGSTISLSVCYTRGHITTSIHPLVP
ncbi:hypothetical protein Pcinc_034735 [Petrolisthes cinctipes]|uniref:Ig-like domain-containing protein n=1 Tax=Petrolisthes cinctipes TaxID=88211 RepID=A0AAE1BY46_PETCI|nr:hypothetical protein Pcinc_034735 [Petrolisthes cinctipes]